MYLSDKALHPFSTTTQQKILPIKFWHTTDYKIYVDFNNVKAWESNVFRIIEL